MEKLKFSFDDALFTYAISSRTYSIFQNQTPLFHGALTIYHTAGTEVRQCTVDDREVTVIGFCVDAHGELSQKEIPAYLLKASEQGIKETYRSADRLNGKYIVCCETGEGRYIFGDATCSIQINYTFKDDEFCASSTDQMVANHCGYAMSEYSLKIRKGSSSFSQPLPFDLTMFDKVKALLPNHYLDIEQRKPVRVPLEIQQVKTEVEKQKIIDHSIELIRNTTKAYCKSYDFVCPLSGGNDSRIVFSFLKEQISDLTCYTFKHKNFTEQTDDLWIPIQICKDYQLEHMVIPDLEATQDYIDAMKPYVGDYHARTTYSLICTILSQLRGKAISNGDIIGQIGKSVMGGTLSTRYATASFFQCKIHNIEKTACDELRQYLMGIRQAGQWDYVYDLFGMENRIGRWSAQGGTLYAMASIPILNLFNCRELVGMWISVERELRVKRYIHRFILERREPHLFAIPANPSSKTGVFKKIPGGLLIGTYGKQILLRLRGVHP